MKKIIVVLLALFIAVLSFSASQVSGGAIIYQGKPVNAQTMLPFMNMEQAAKSSQIFTSPTAQISTIKAGFYQYNSPQGETFLYKCAGIIGLDYIVEIIYDGGGSGVFTSIISVTMSGNTLYYSRDIADGDRTAGGVTSVLVTNGSVIYSQNITPYGLMALTGIASSHYANLSDNMISSVGISNSIYHFRFKKSEILSVSLSAETNNNGSKYYNLVQDKKSGVKSQQLAFEKLYNRYVGGGKSLLTKEDLKNFSINYLKYIAVKK
ncbi:MAG: hypothetical protein NTX05_06760 [Fusobacteria bacterium]|nr:hypothetical protein [Fusobacteriota bacterium]